MNTLETIFTRKSVRQFKNQKVDEKDIKTILKAGMSGPTCVNSKDWSFIVVDDPEVLHKMYQANGVPAKPLLECAFSFNQKFRDYFSAVTGVSPFKFNADMATAWRKVKTENDLNFTIQDMLKVYYGESDYAKYDNSACQWNQFLKDFCSDEFSNYYSNKLKVAAIIWKEVRD